MHRTHADPSVGLGTGALADEMARLGASEVELLASDPTLRAQDLCSAWAYYRAHPDEIEQQIRENESA